MLSLIQFSNVLRKRCPANKPVKVRVTKLPYCDRKNNLRLYGDSLENDDHYIIRINKESDLLIQKETLMHEWAHCLAGWEDGKSPHSREWGIAYAKIYRIMVEDDESD